MKQIVIFIFLIQISSASWVSRSDWFTISVALSFFLFATLKSKSLTIDKYFVWLILTFTFLILVYFVKNGTLDPVTFAGLLLKISIAYSIRRIFRHNYLKILVQGISLMTAISLILFPFQLMFPETVFDLNNLVGLEVDLKETSNSLFFNIDLNLHSYRNSGFMWEPGAFAAVLLIGLYLNLELSLVKSSAVNIILVIGILSSLSTTGYVVLVFIFLSQLNWRVKDVLIIFTPVVTVILVAFLNIDFLGQKIFDQFIGLDDEILRVEHANSINYLAGLSRFGSVVVDLPIILDHPLIGLGPDMYTTSSDTLYSNFGENVVRSSGLVNLMVQTGFLGLLAYSIILYKNAPFQDNYKKFIWLVLIYLILFSNPLEFSALIMSFFFHYKLEKV